TLRSQPALGEPQATPTVPASLGLPWSPWSPVPAALAALAALAVGYGSPWGARAGGGAGAGTAWAAPGGGGSSGQAWASGWPGRGGSGRASRACGACHAPAPAHADAPSPAAESVRLASSCHRVVLPADRLNATTRCSWAGLVRPEEAVPGAGQAGQGSVS